MEIINDKRLGRGLSALLGEAHKSKNFSEFENSTIMNGDPVKLMSVSNIVAGIYQPRKLFDNQKLTELSDSIRENGIIQPIIVRIANDRGTFEIVAGERRFKAAKMAGLDKVPVIIKDINNIQAREFAIIENVQRSDLSPIEEAHGYKQLINEFNYKQEQVAKKIGCSRSHIANILRLLSLPKEVQIMLDHGKISFGHAKVIMNSANIIEIAKQIVENNLTVREVEKILKEGDDVKLKNKSADFKKSQSSEKNNKSQIQQVKNIELQLSKLLPNHTVKAEYNQQKQQGKITIFFKDLQNIKDLISGL